MAKDLTEEEIMADDLDPIEAIAAIRREEGVAEEDLPVSDGDNDSSGDPDTNDDAQEGDDELDNLDEEDGKDDESEDADPDAEDAKDGDKEPDEGDDDQDDADADATEDKPAEVNKRKFKANGQEFEFSDTEILEQFEVVFGQSMNYTQKMQAMAPYRKMISALETEGITSEQLNTAIDALKGNKNALKDLLDKNKIDPYDLADPDEDGKDAYTPTEYGKDETQLGIEDVAREISGDAEYKITVDVIDKQWDQTSRQSFASNPQLIKGLHSDIKSGVFDEVAPVMMKMKVLDGNTKSDIEYYMLAGEKVLAEKQQTSDNSEKTVADKNKKAQDVDDEFDQASSEASKKRSASTTRKRADRKGVTDYLDDDDEDYDAWYKKLMASS